MKNGRRYLALIISVACATAVWAKPKQQVALERDVAKFWNSVKGSKKYNFVRSIEAGGDIAGVSEPNDLYKNPFVMVNGRWRQLPEARKRRVATELFSRWRPYCKRSGRYASLYLQATPGGQPVAQCSEDDGCSLETD